MLRFGVLGSLALGERAIVVQGSSRALESLGFRVWVFRSDRLCAVGHVVNQPSTEGGLVHDPEEAQPGIAINL